MYFKKLLQANINNCMTKLVQFGDYWAHIEPLLTEHPEWNVGDAEDYLKSIGVNVHDLWNSAGGDADPTPDSLT